MGLWSRDAIWELIMQHFRQPHPIGLIRFLLRRGPLSGLYKGFTCQEGLTRPSSGFFRGLHNQHEVSEYLTG